MQDADRRPVHLIGENRQFAFFLRTVIDFDLGRLKRLSKSAAATFVSASPSYFVLKWHRPMRRALDARRGRYKSEATLLHA